MDSNAADIAYIAFPKPRWTLQAVVHYIAFYKTIPCALTDNADFYYLHLHQQNPSISYDFRCNKFWGKPLYECFRITPRRSIDYERLVAVALNALRSQPQPSPPT